MVGWLEQLWDAMTAVSLPLLVLGIAFQTAQTLLVALAWRNILRSAYPGGDVRYRPILSYYAGGTALNAVLPASAGTVTMIGFFRTSIEGSTVAGSIGATWRRAGRPGAGGALSPVPEDVGEREGGWRDPATSTAVSRPGGRGGGRVLRRPHGRERNVHVRLPHPGLASRTSSSSSRRRRSPRPSRCCRAGTIRESSSTARGRRRSRTRPRPTATSRPPIPNWAARVRPARGAARRRRPRPRPHPRCPRLRRPDPPRSG
jgi:hypothetical protein